MSEILNPDSYRNYIETFNRQDSFEGNSGIPNSGAWEYLRDRIPLFDCPDRELMLTYYFRWWVFRKHIHETPEGRVITEFLPQVSWSGKYNTISMAAPFHIEEARWLRDEDLYKEYLSFWYSGESKLHDYSCSLPWAAMDAAKVTGNTDFVLSLYEPMKEEHEKWENGFDWDFGTWDPERYYGVHRIGMRENGLFYTCDDLEGSEYSASGHGFRPLLNSCMYGSRKTLSEIAHLLGKSSEEESYRKSAMLLKKKILEQLWNPDVDFFTVRDIEDNQSDARELYGYTPWIFGIPEKENESAWLALQEKGGFRASVATPFLVTSHPKFSLRYDGHSCKWDGPSWPLGTSFMLKAMISLLHSEGNHPVDREDFFEYLSKYARCQRLVTESGEIVPWIDENQNPYTGEWIARKILGGSAQTVPRGKDYNHSAFADLIITGLCGLIPSFDDEIKVEPLVPDGVWDYFCLDRVRYHGMDLTILWDKDGNVYNRGKGFRVYADGELILSRPNLN